MKKSQANKWIKALRSGKFKQTSGALRAKNESDQVTGHCCLGVLAEINKCDDTAIDRNDLLSHGLMEQCGISSDDGDPLFNKDGSKPSLRFKTKDGHKEFNSLAEANDDGISFKRIATWIEKNYENL